MLISLQFQAKKIEGLATGVSLSEAYALSEWHMLSEALSSLNVLENPKRGSVTNVRAQHAANSPSESFVLSRTQRAQLAKLDFTNSRLASQARDRKSVV